MSSYILLIDDGECSVSCDVQQYSKYGYTTHHALVCLHAKCHNTKLGHTVVTCIPGGIRCTKLSFTDLPCSVGAVQFCCLYVDSLAPGICSSNFKSIIFAHHTKCLLWNVLVWTPHNHCYRKYKQRCPRCMSKYGLTSIKIYSALIVLPVNKPTFNSLSNIGANQEPACVWKECSWCIRQDTTLIYTEQ